LGLQSAHGAGRRAVRARDRARAGALARAAVGARSRPPASGCWLLGLRESSRAAADRQEPLARGGAGRAPGGPVWLLPILPARLGPAGVESSSSSSEHCAALEQAREVAGARRPSGYWGAAVVGSASLEALAFVGDARHGAPSLTAGRPAITVTDQSARSRAWSRGIRDRGRPGDGRRGVLIMSNYSLHHSGNI
jgi:hypothetical protein